MKNTPSRLTLQAARRRFLDSDNKLPLTRCLKLVRRLQADAQRTAKVDCTVVTTGLTEVYVALNYEETDPAKPRIRFHERAIFSRHDTDEVRLMRMTLLHTAYHLLLQTIDNPQFPTTHDQQQ